MKSFSLLSATVLALMMSSASFAQSTVDSFNSTINTFNVLNNGTTAPIAPMPTTNSIANMTNNMYYMNAQNRRSLHESQVQLNNQRLRTEKLNSESNATAVARTNTRTQATEHTQGKSTLHQNAAGEKYVVTNQNSGSGNQTRTFANPDGSRRLRNGTVTNPQTTSSKAGNMGSKTRLDPKTGRVESVVRNSKATPSNAKTTLSKVNGETRFRDGTVIQHRTVTTKSGEVTRSVRVDRITKSPTTYQQTTQKYVAASRQYLPVTYRQNTYRYPYYWYAHSETNNDSNTQNAHKTISGTPVETETKAPVPTPQNQR